MGGGGRGGVGAGGGERVCSVGWCWRWGEFSTSDVAHNAQRIFRRAVSPLMYIPGNITSPPTTTTPRTPECKNIPLFGIFERRAEMASGEKTPSRGISRVVLRPHVSQRYLHWSHRGPLQHPKSVFGGESLPYSQFATLYQLPIPISISKLFAVRGGRGVHFDSLRALRPRISTVRRRVGTMRRMWLCSYVWIVRLTGVVRMGCVGVRTGVRI